VSSQSKVWNALKRFAKPAAAVLLIESFVAVSAASFLKHRKRNKPAALSLSGKLIQAIEDERRRIARELHDDIGQRLSLVSVQLDSLKRHAAQGSLGYETDLEDLFRELATLVTDVHDLSHSLHSAKLENLGLEAALAELCLRVSRRQGLETKFVSENLPKDLDPDVALCLYRVAQEGLSNVVKHSGASQALVKIAFEGGLLKMQIIDQGIGYTATDGAPGLGFATMRERLVAVAGTLSITSEPGLGTTVRAQAPVLRPSVAREKDELASLSFSNRGWTATGL
jgi:signal transduction histidine kinase